MYYVCNNREETWQAAARSAPLRYRMRYRIPRWTLSFEQIEQMEQRKSEKLSPGDSRRFADWEVWIEFKNAIQPGDLIWPFEFNCNKSAWRQGYVVIRKGKPVGGDHQHELKGSQIK